MMLVRARRNLRRARSWVRLVKKILGLLLAVVVGAALGLAVTAIAIESPPNFGVIESGPWVARPGIGSTNADPYSRALMAARGEIPMGASDGIVLTASRDSGGQALNLRCTYKIDGAVPPTNFWTLTLYRSDGAVPAADGRIAYTSSEALVAENGQVTIMLSADPFAGNWIPLSGTGAFELHLRLYETQLSSTGHALEKVPMPSIAREKCP